MLLLEFSYWYIRDKEHQARKELKEEEKKMNEETKLNENRLCEYQGLLRRKEKKKKIKGPGWHSYLIQTLTISRSSGFTLQPFVYGRGRSYYCTVNWS